MFSIHKENNKKKDMIKKNQETYMYIFVLLAWPRDQNIFSLDPHESEELSQKKSKPLF